MREVGRENIPHAQVAVENVLPGPQSTGTSASPGPVCPCGLAHRPQVLPSRLSPQSAAGSHCLLLAQLKEAQKGILQHHPNEENKASFLISPVFCAKLTSINDY